MDNVEDSKISDQRSAPTPGSRVARKKQDLLEQDPCLEIFYRSTGTCGQPAASAFLALLLPLFNRFSDI